jgi:hypothetical protein
MLQVKISAQILDILTEISRVYCQYLKNGISLKISDLFLPFFIHLPFIIIATEICIIFEADKA